jgi:hypothetical protein
MDEAGWHLGAPSAYPAPCGEGKVITGICLADSASRGPARACCDIALDGSNPRAVPDAAPAIELTSRCQPPSGPMLTAKALPGRKLDCSSQKRKVRPPGPACRRGVTRRRLVSFLVSFIHIRGRSAHNT